MAYLETEPGRRIYYEYYPGEALPVVLIHGWGMNCRLWDTVLPLLTGAGHGVLSFDQRGCGRSDKDYADVSISSAASDVVSLANHLRLERLAVNGWSLGGPVAVAAAVRLGARCAGVISTAGATPRYVQAPDFPHGGAPGSVAETVALLRQDRASFLHGLAHAICARPVSDAVKTWMWSAFMENAPSADTALLDLDTLDQRDLLRGLAVPLLSVVGGQDVIAPPGIGRAAAELAPLGRLAEFPECGHAPFIEETARYGEVLLEFLAELG
ncbi:alpha/beta hydrolase [Emcibacter sp. SYSU 3D8]|uniref:alpha/beta fold hydrolase n=1 Tax=Emcibacter sp. SYSU 3D8 TaxID=3133969 RepID=UPI0031FE70E4